MVTELYFGCSDLLTVPVPVIYHRNWELHVVADGLIAPLFCDNRSHAFKSNYIWLMPPGLSYGWRSASNRVKRYIMHFSSVPLLLSQTVGKEGYFGRQITTGEMSRIAGICHIFDQHSISGTLLSGLHSEKAELDLALLLVNGTEIETETPRDVLGEQRIEAALKWFREHIFESPSVEDVATAMGFSSGHLRRIFKSVRGCSLQVAFMEVRLECAKVLLRNSSINVSDVAVQCGFRHSSDFCRVFKKHIGISPLKWRKQAVGKDFRRPAREVVWDG